MRVTINKLAERRLWAFIRAKSVEVGGMGYATLTDNDLHWSDTFLVPQEVSSSEVDFESTHGDQVAIERATADGVLDNPGFVWVSWHSHHTMDAYWSSTDAKRIAEVQKVGVTRLLSFVGNHKGEYELRLDLFDVSAHDVYIGQVRIEDLKLTSEPRDADPFFTAIADELAENVTHKKYSTSISSYSKSNSKAKSDDIKDELIEDLFAEGYSLTDAQAMIAGLGVDGTRALLDESYPIYGGGVQ